MTHHVSIPDAFGRWVLSHRLLILSAVAVVTLLAAAAAARAPIRTTILEGFMADQSRFLEYRERAAQFGGGTDDIIYVATREGPQLFTADKLNAVREAADELARHGQVARVSCLPDAPWTGSRPLSAAEIIGRRLARRRILSGRPLPDNRQYLPPVYWPRSEPSQAEADLPAIRQAALEDDMLRGVLVSRDGTCQAMVVQLQPDAHLSGRQQWQIRLDIEEILNRHGLGRDGVYTAGVLISQGWMLHEAIRSMLVLFPLGAAVVSVLIQWVFGRLSLVALTMLISGIAVVWAVGATALVFGEITLLVAATPLLVLVIATADTVHLASAYTAEVESGVAPRPALLKVIRDVGGACILTSVTTAVGFLSLMVVPAATIRHSALAASVGVGGALLLALTLVPIVLSWLPVRPPHKTDSRGRLRVGLINRVIDALVRWCKAAALGRPRLVVALHLAVVALAVLSALRIEADADFSKRFPQSHPHRQSVEFFSRELIGANALEVYLSSDPERLLEPSMLAAIDRLDQRIRQLPQVESVVSLTSLLREGCRAMELNSDSGLPPSRVAAEGLLQLAAMSDAGVESLVLPQQGMTRLLVRVAPTRLFQMLDVARRVERLAEQLPAGVDVDVTGMYPIIGRAATAIIDNQVKGFFICFACVMTLVAVGLRSLRLAVLAVAPNLLPLCLLAGALGLTVGMVDTDALGIAVVSFGLAVDDTIHFLHRYDIELSGAGRPLPALQNTFDYTGQAIVRTTLILGIGLSPFALSGYLSVQLLGTYLVLVLACAVFGDLLLLPATILLLAKERGSTS